MEEEWPDPGDHHGSGIRTIRTERVLKRILTPATGLLFGSGKKKQRFAGG